MWIGWLELSLRLGDVHSAKARTARLDSVSAELRERFGVSSSEVGETTTHRTALLGVGLVGNERQTISSTLDKVEMFVATFPHVDVTEARRKVWDTEEH